MIFVFDFLQLIPEFEKQMFTGIIMSTGCLQKIEFRDGDCRLSIATESLPILASAVGESIAVNGVCLTAIELDDHCFKADVSNETLSRTTLGEAKVGALLNLELALTATSRLGGHFVSGHVDGVGVILEKRGDARSVRFKIRAPDELAKYIAEKGSICVDGISLTVNSVKDSVFDVNIVPHTLSKTTLGKVDIGTRVNLEVDLLARYLERLLLGSSDSTVNTDLTKDILEKAGFNAEN